MQKLWKVKEPDFELQKKLADSLKISPILAQILINRGLTNQAEAVDFLRGDLSNLHDPHLLKDMGKAVGKIKKAIKFGEKIMVWGDYDADGITAVALLMLVLSRLGAEVTHYIPNRIQEGYGLNKEGADRAQRCGVRLLITVDCGIGEYQEVDYLNQLGIDTIITDHHEPIGDNLPKSFAIINPLQEGCSYPYKYLSGVGLAFKLAQALCPNNTLEEHLDLAALGTVADVVPITGENRILAKYGLMGLSQTRKEGLRALIDLVGLGKKPIRSGHIGYILGPRINAQGRLGSSETSLRLLLTQSSEEAATIARTLDRSNRERQKVEEETLEEAINKVEREINFKHHRAIVLASDKWHPGVIGIVASRLVGKYYRPTIMVAFKEGLGRGSGRSIRNFHLLDALSKCKAFLEEYGGHQWACGITVSKDNLDRFAASLNEVASDVLSAQDLMPTIDIDVETPLHQLSDELIEHIEALSPFGPGNPRPIFSSRGLELKSEPQVVGRNHLKLWVTDCVGTYEAIGFKMASFLPLLRRGVKLDLAYSPAINIWKGEKGIQLQIEDIKMAGK